MFDIDGVRLRKKIEKAREIDKRRGRKNARTRNGLTFMFEL